jgi:hypothetical protein
VAIGYVRFYYAVDVDYVVYTLKMNRTNEVAMRWVMTLLVLISMLTTVSALAGELTVSVEIPSMDVAEYHRPYVAIWVAEDSTGVVTNLSVRYAIEMDDQEGHDWLKDIRQWWRRTGRSLTLPIDGVSAATPAPGVHKLNFKEGMAPLGKLTAGNYQLFVEASREVGGREMLQIPFRWPQKTPQEFEVQGNSELGAIKLVVKP